MKTSSDQIFPPPLKTEAAAAKGGVPAILHAVGIFEFLKDRGNEPATMTEIAAALAMNPSTCFNILRTLEGADLLARDDDSKRYRLGVGLRELAAAVGGEDAVLLAARNRAAEFVRAYKLIMLLCHKAEDDSFVVVDKLRGRPDPRGTVPLGGRVPPNGAVLSKAYYAHRPEAEVDQMLDVHGLPARTQTSITEIAEFKAQLAEVRDRGYSVSLGEYEPDYNAVGAAVLDPEGAPVMLMIVTGHSSFMPTRLIPAIGARLRQAADDVTTSAYHLSPTAAGPGGGGATTTGRVRKHESRSRRRAARDEGRSRAL
ncbi:MAG TPA: IclR family transcriptional regulator [Solirubrobacterales bacterium]|nr:IclR family transcriptional regulator [Solirubrobacterales bacterium]